MKKSFSYILFICFSLAFVGCFGFDPSYRKVHFYGTQPYYLPQDARIYHSANMLAKLEKAGITCATNSAIWLADDDKIPALEMLSDMQIRSLYSEHKLGCDTPISDQELEYIKHREIIEHEEWQMQQDRWQRQQEMMELRQLEYERMKREDRRRKW